MPQGTETSPSFISHAFRRQIRFLMIRYCAAVESDLPERR